MTVQKVEKRKRKTDNWTVSINWQYVKESSPAFKHLMMLLLRDKSEKSGVEKQDRLS